MRRLRNLFLQVREKEKQLEKIKYSYVSRDKDFIKRADKLANLAIDDFSIIEGEGEKEMDKEDACNNAL